MAAVFKKREIKKQYQYGIFCSDCDMPLEQIPEVLTTDPPQFVFMCPKCGKKEYISELEMPDDLTEFGEWEKIITTSIITSPPILL